jgi:hypothetical protein
VRVSRAAAGGQEAHGPLRESTQRLQPYIRAAEAAEAATPMWARGCNPIVCARRCNLAPTVGARANLVCSTYAYAYAWARYRLTDEAERGEADDELQTESPQRESALVRGRGRGRSGVRVRV